MSRRILAVPALAALVAVATVAPALAQQSGLVSAQVGDVTVGVPVAVAANVCGIDVNVLATQFVGSEDAACEADADAMALVPRPFRP